MMNSDNSIKDRVKKGILYLVATPIGNMEDISERAVKTLREADIVACEDTRRTGTLLKRLGIKKRLISYHEHNKSQRKEPILSLLNEGNSVALVSDAGTPCISDPGEDLVKACVKDNIEITVIPGACAAISALSASELSSKRFAFEGFIPASGKNRKEALSLIAEEKRTVVMYEAPHRIKKTLSDLEKTGLGDRKITVGRELTKIHEEFIRKTVKEAFLVFEEKNPKGEFVLIIEGSDEYIARKGDKSISSGADNTEEIKEYIRHKLAMNMSVKDISADVSNKFKLPKKKAYSIALEIKEQIT